MWLMPMTTILAMHQTNIIIYQVIELELAVISLIIEKRAEGFINNRKLLSYENPKNKFHQKMRILTQTG